MPSARRVWPSSPQLKGKDIFASSGDYLAHDFSALVSAIVEHGDYYLVSDDFNSYCKTQDLIDESYKNQDEWITKCITSVARMGFFSSDRCIDEYAEMIWNIEPLDPSKEGIS